MINIAVLFYLADIPEEDECAILNFSIGANSATGATIKMKVYNLLMCTRMIMRNLQVDDVASKIDQKLLEIPAKERGQSFNAFSAYCKAYGLGNMAGMIIFSLTRWFLFYIHKNEYIIKNTLAAPTSTAAHQKESLKELHTVACNMTQLALSKMGNLHEANRIKHITIPMLVQDLFILNPEVQVVILCMLSSSTAKTATLAEATEVMLSCVRLHSVANKIKSFGEGIAKEILILKASIAASSKVALEIVTIQEDIDKLLSSHEDSVKAKLEEVSKMASVSLCS